jgi:hypothetical protein
MRTCTRARTSSNHEGGHALEMGHAKKNEAKTSMILSTYGIQSIFFQLSLPAPLVIPGTVLSFLESAGETPRNGKSLPAGAALPTPKNKAAHRLFEITNKNRRATWKQVDPGTRRGKDEPRAIGHRWNAASVRGEATPYGGPSSRPPPNPKESATAGRVRRAGQANRLDPV